MSRSTRSNPKDVVVDEEYEARIAQIKVGKRAASALGQAFSSHLAAGTSDRGICVSASKRSQADPQNDKKEKPAGAKKRKVMAKAAKE